MPASSFDKRNISTSRQPWLATLSPGVSLANLFALYLSKGDTTIAGATSIPTTLDGPIQVARYGALTVNAALTASNRCRGLVILADSLVMGAAGSISMTARGAAGSAKWANQDIGIPTSIVLSGKNTSQKAFLDWLASTGYCIWDPTLFKCPPPGMGDVLADWADWPAKMAAIVSAAGCGVPVEKQTTGAGTVGSAGTNAPGSGGTGGSNGYAAASGPGTVWGGGPGSGGCGTYSSQLKGCAPDPYGCVGGIGGPPGATYNSGGGAGNPGGAGYRGSGAGVGADGSTGTGGVLIVIVRGNVTLTAGHALTSAGTAGGAASGNTTNCGGGGSGGGFVGLYYSGALTGTPNITAAGGDGGASTNAGGAGGAGTAVSATFSAKGWT